MKDKKSKYIPLEELGNQRKKDPNVNYQFDVDLFGGESFEKSTWKKYYDDFFLRNRRITLGTIKVKLNVLAKKYEENEEADEEEGTTKESSTNQQRGEAQIFLVNMEDRKSFESMKEAFLREEAKDKNFGNSPLRMVVMVDSGISSFRVLQPGDLRGFIDEHNTIVFFPNITLPVTEEAWRRENKCLFENLLAKPLMRKYHKEISKCSDFDEEFITKLKNSEGYRGLEAHTLSMKDEIKRKAVETFISEIDNALSRGSLDDLSTIILEGDYSEIIDNTGTGCYALLSCITGGAQSTSHKHLMQLQSDFENLCTCTRITLQEQTESKADTETTVLD